MTDEATTSTRQQILEAVITVIESEGIDSLTTRKIAEAAGSNVASINYYFRTKDALVAEVLAMTARHTLEDVEALAGQPEQSFEQALEEVFFYLIEGSLRFPGTTLAHMYAILLEKRYDTEAAHMFREIFSRLEARAREAYPDTDGGAIQAALAHALSSVLLSVLTPGLFLPGTPLELSGEEDARKLARYLTQVFAASLRVSPGALHE